MHNGDASSLTSIDLRTVEKTGLYYCVSCTNRPTGQNGFLLAQVYNSLYKSMIYTPVTGKQFQCSCVNGTWSAWQEITTQDSATLTGTPTAPTALTGTNTTQIATTAFVQAALASIVTTGSGTGYYWRKWSNGDMEIWGTVTAPVNTSTVIPFSVTFPNSCDFVMLSTNNTVGGVTYALSVSAKTRQPLLF